MQFMLFTLSKTLIITSEIVVLTLNLSTFLIHLNGTHRATLITRMNYNPPKLVYKMPLFRSFPLTYVLVPEAVLCLWSFNRTHKTSEYQIMFS